VVAGKRCSSRSVARNLPRLARSNRCRMGGIVATGTDCSDHRGVASATYRALAIRQMSDSYGRKRPSRSAESAWVPSHHADVDDRRSSSKTKSVLELAEWFRSVRRKPLKSPSSWLHDKDAGGLRLAIPSCGPTSLSGSAGAGSSMICSKPLYGTI
jgi:hypothetical protein